MLEFNRFKSYSHSDGLIDFRVPKAWEVEVENDGNSVFWDSRGNSGTLRVSVITVKKEDIGLPNPELEFIGFEPNYPNPVYLDNGNGFRKYQTVAEEDGHKLLIHWFELGNHIRPIYYRLAIFSFTVLEAQISDKNIVRQLSLIEQEVCSAKFSSELLPSEL